MNGDAENIFASELNKFGKTFTLPVDNRRCEVKGHTNMAQGYTDVARWCTWCSHFSDCGG